MNLHKENFPLICMLLQTQNIWRILLFNYKKFTSSGVCLNSGDSCYKYHLHAVSFNRQLTGSVHHYIENLETVLSKSCKSSDKKMS